MKKKVLMITYDFPPIGGGGIQRNVKYLKYLSQMEWDTNVLTVENRDFYVFDNSLLEEVKNTAVYRADSMDLLRISYKLKKFKEKITNKFFNVKEVNDHVLSDSKVKEGAWHVSVYRFVRNWFLLPDGYGGWIPYATKLGLKIIEEKKIDVLFATFPAPSNAFVVYKLYKISKLPYVLDFRDGWIDDPYAQFASSLHKKYHAYHERKIILGAKRIVVYGEPLKFNLLKRYPILKDKIEVIKNGYDPEDFVGLKSKIKNANKIRLVYSGSVYIDRRETYTNFINAVSSLNRDIKDKLEIFFVGDKLDWAYDLVVQEKLEDVISFTGYVNHKEALEYLISGDGTLLFLGAGDKIALTGKIFEYIATQLPIIACAEPEGACALLLKSLNHDQGVCDPSNFKEIALKLEQFVNGKLPFLKDGLRETFSRFEQAQQLDKVLSSVI